MKKLKKGDKLWTNYGWGVIKATYMEDNIALTRKELVDLNDRLWVRRETIWDKIKKLYESK